MKAITSFFFAMLVLVVVGTLEPNRSQDDRISSIAALRLCLCAAMAFAFWFSKSKEEGE